MWGHSIAGWHNDMVTPCRIAGQVLSITSMPRLCASAEGEVHDPLEAVTL